MACTVTVDGDIPPGAEVRVTVAGSAAGVPWEKVCVNPVGERISGGMEAFSLRLDPPPGSIAVPLVFGVTFEADGRVSRFSAEQLARDQDLVAADLVLMRPMGHRPFLTRAWLRGADVSASDVGRPWLLEVKGGTPRDSSILVVLRATESDGTVWEQGFHGPCREPLRSTTFVSVQWHVRLQPTSDGYQTSWLEGVVIEGDHRRFALPAVRMVEEVW